MSKTTHVQQLEQDDDDQESEESNPPHQRLTQEEEEEERYFEALDRILSSSNSSTSTSEEDDAVLPSASPRCFAGVSPAFRRHGKSNSLQSYDLWVSTESFSLSSLEQRRDRLFRALGLSSDQTLTRRKVSSSEDFGRSVSFDQLGSPPTHPPNSGNANSSNINRSKSEGCCNDQCNSSASTSSILSIRDTVNSNSSNINKHTGNGNSTSNNNNRDGVVAVVDNVTSKKSFGSNSGLNKAIPEVGESAQSRVSDIESGCIEEVCNEDDKIDRVCLIKNLDNGKEFVVNEVREDGMWNKLREVGTGRHLTMEEFEMCVGHSPIVQELMRRQNVKDHHNNNKKDNVDPNGSGETGSKLKKKAGWLKSIKNVATSVAGYRERRSSDERDTSSEKGGRRSSSATDDSQDTSFNGPERVRVRQYGKNVKELSAVYKSQEIQAHNGSIWTIKFSLDGWYLASAGEDCVIHIWQVVECERKGDLLVDKPDDGSLNLLFLTNGSPEPSWLSPKVDNPLERRRRGRTSISRKSVSLDHIVVPETVFGLSEKPICSFQGHSGDVLDLSWSKSQLLLSSSMDKTVCLWSLSSKTCLKVFSHSDYVTCIQFNPVDDRYFISGSLDGKVRIWSIPDRQVVDWNDMNEMVTAACYTPDGQGALVGSYKGTCRLYDTSENKLQPKCHINLQNKKKKSHLKKITGFQFAPGSSSEVLITSADSRVRVVDGVDLVHKFKGFRNTNSQISASLSANGKYVVCASEDSHVYIWKHEGDSSRPNRSKTVTVTRTYEHFHSQDVCVAIPWPGLGPGDPCGPREDPPSQDGPRPHPDEGPSSVNHPPTPAEPNGNATSDPATGCTNSPLRGTISSAPNGYFFERMSVTWPEEKLTLAAKGHSPRPSLDFSSTGVVQGNRSAWGLVIVTAGLRGEIRTFQNFGLPVRI